LSTRELQGRLHEKCREKCTRRLVCGHQCREPCAMNCPPCKLKCETQCEHSKCKNRCHEPCVPCKYVNQQKPVCFSTGECGLIALHLSEKSASGNASTINARCCAVNHVIDHLATNRVKRFAFHLKFLEFKFRCQTTKFL